MERDVCRINSKALSRKPVSDILWVICCVECYFPMCWLFSSSKETCHVHYSIHYPRLFTYVAISFASRIIWTWRPSTNRFRIISFSSTNVLPLTDCIMFSLKAFYHKNITLQNHVLWWLTAPNQSILTSVHSMYNSRDNLGCTFQALAITLSLLKQMGLSLICDYVITIIE